MRSVESVPVLSEEELTALPIADVSIHKGRLLDLAATEERGNRWRSPSLNPDPQRIYHRADERWLSQWLVAKEVAWRRRREHTEPVWCVVANVVREQRYGPGGALSRVGTRTLRGGARVSIIDGFFGTCEAVTVIARVRGRGRWTRTNVSVRHLEKLRAKLVYEPSVIDAYFMHWAGSGWREADARRAELDFLGWQRELEGHRQRWRGKAVLPLAHHAAVGGAIGKDLHRVDLRFTDGSTRMGVPMSGPYFAEEVEFSPEDIVEVRCAEDAALHGPDS